MWSIGIISYALLCGKLPIEVNYALKEKEQNPDLMDRIATFDEKNNPCFTERCFTELETEPQEFLKALLKKDQFERASAEAAIKLTWILNYSQDILRDLKNEIAKHAFNNGGSLTINCLRSLKNFKKTPISEDDA